MARRNQVINKFSLQNLFVKQPYLSLFQKENWAEYLELLALLYDLIEENGQNAPYESVRIFIHKFYANSGRELNFIENKTGQFILMCISELKVLRDFHNGNGQRMIELTRPGKQLLQLVEGMLVQKIKYSGTSAETLLSALNDALTTGNQLDKESAIAHHKEKINAYKKDLKNIEQKGPAFAQLLPMPHSVEALFSQAESAATDITIAVEDVKQAIEEERKKLAQSYLRSNQSSGKSVNAVAEFYHNLHQSPSYVSYIQAKDIFSHLKGHGQRFHHKNVDQIIQKLDHGKKLPTDQIKKSQLNGFQKLFEMADMAIQEKIRAQLHLLQLQVRYSLSNDAKGLQSNIKEVLQACFKNKDKMLAFFNDDPIKASYQEIECGKLGLFHFEKSDEVHAHIVEELLDDHEAQELISALLRAEETTLKKVMDQFLITLGERETLDIADYPFQYGPAEYYVLSEIELFTGDVLKQEIGKCDLSMSLNLGTIIIRDAKNYRYSFRSFS